MKTCSFPALSRQTDWLSWLLLVALALLAQGAVAYDDPPERVARLSVISGDIGFLPAGDRQWRDASLNRPLIAGDRLYTERDARTELDLGDAALRLDQDSEVALHALDDELVRVELVEGTLNLGVRQVYADERYEIETPMLTLVATEPVRLRIDSDPRGGTQVSVYSGRARVQGVRGGREYLDAGYAYRFEDPALRDLRMSDLPYRDDFDSWSLARDDRYRNAVSRRYVSPRMIGYSDLDEYGDWHEDRSYGPVWYPRRVASSWAPYRDGHWAWVEPWGWTWVDHAPWGFAPFHYGRWVYVSHRWGWIPGPVAVRPVYAPALVAFIGGSNWSIGIRHGVAPIGWYPLGPRDVYMPAYRVSRNYFQRVNVTNIHHHHHTVINQTVINNYYDDHSHGTAKHRHTHTYRDEPAAITAVAREDFVKARHVDKARLKLGRDQLRQAEVVTAPALEPTTESIAPPRTTGGRDKPTRGEKRGRETNAPNEVESAPQDTSQQEDALPPRRARRDRDRDDGALSPAQSSDTVPAVAPESSAVDETRRPRHRDESVRESSRAEREPRRREDMESPAPESRSMRRERRTLQQEAPAEAPVESPAEPPVEMPPPVEPQTSRSQSRRAERERQAPSHDRDAVLDSGHPVQQERNPERSYMRPPREERTAPAERDSHRAAREKHAYERSPMIDAPQEVRIERPRRDTPEPNRESFARHAPVQPEAAAMDSRTARRDERRAHRRSQAQQTEGGEQAPDAAVAQ